ncbi:hypothetical protein L596_015237 [Steinernema carpocapsae]|uniref:Uncharacterized protein n=1 Tax=Steinernema carpocapsae TaxID=34508 RepID=A0A4U5NEY8_STECR|nr:hypothetical protein L596_015237 [Steinernema carpocapsae]
MKDLEEYDWGVYYRQNNGIKKNRITAKSQPTFERSGDGNYLKELEDYDDVEVLEHQKHFTDNPPQLRVNLPTTTLSPFSDHQELVPLRNGENLNTNNNGPNNNVNANNNFNGNGFGNQNGFQPPPLDNGNFLQNFFNPNIFGQGGQGFFNGAAAQPVTPHPLLNVFSLFTFPQGRR